MLFLKCYDIQVKFLMFYNNIMESLIFYSYNNNIEMQFIL